MSYAVNMTLMLEHEYNGNYNNNNMAAMMVVNNCDSNSTVWQLTGPLCSINFSSFWVLVGVAILLSIITIWTIFGNVLVWLALYRFPNLRSMSNLLIGNLALSDWLLALTVLPISATNDLLGYWVFGKDLCRVWLVIDVLYCTASIWGLCTIAVDRYTATVYPVWYYERRSPKRALIYIIFVWLFSIIVCIAPFIGWRDMIPDLYQYNPSINRYECLLFQTEGYVLYSAMCSFVIPIFLMTFIYVRIFSVLRKRMKLLKPKRHIRTYIESDVDSCVCPDKPNKIELTSSEPSLMKDQATQISPLLSKSGRNSLLEPNSFVICNPQNTKNQYLKNKSNINEEEKSNASTKAETQTNHCINNTNHLDTTSTVNNGSETKTILNSTENINDIKNVKEKTHHYTKDLHLPKIVIKKPKSNESSPGDDVGSQSDITASQYDLDHDEFSNTSSTLPHEKQKKRKKKKQLLKINKRASSIKCKKNQKATKNVNGSSKGRHLHFSGIKTKYELREQRATKRMAIVMACFCICWIPFLFMYTIRSFCSSCGLNIHIQAAIIWLGYANSSLNPILYTLFNEDFRKAFKAILHIGTKNNKKGHNINNTTC